MYENQPLQARKCLSYEANISFCFVVNEKSAIFSSFFNQNDQW
jgi:hypothetical protein